MVEQKNSDDFDAKRMEILATAASVFAEHGFAKGTTKDIATLVGLGQPTLYHYVGSKRELLECLYGEISDLMRQVLDDGMNSSHDPAEQLCAVIHNFVTVVSDNPKLFKVFYQELRSISPSLRLSVESAERQFVHKVSELVNMLQKDGRLPEGSPFVVSEAILSMPIWMYHWYRSEGKLGADEIATVFCSLIHLGK